MFMRLAMSIVAAGSLVAEGAGYRIYSACDENADVRAEVQKDTPLTVQFSIAGGAVCYSVTAMVNGQAVRGYVLDRTLEPVRVFEDARVKNNRESFENQQLVSSTPPAVTPAPAAKPPSAKQDAVKTDAKAQKKEPPPRPKLAM
jgi:hypothetical protein